MESYKLRIKSYRILKGYSQKELAAKVGISQNYLSELENGKYDIKLSLLCKISSVLNVPVCLLFESKINTGNFN